MYKNRWPWNSAHTGFRPRIQPTRDSATDSAHKGFRPRDLAHKGFSPQGIQPTRDSAHMGFSPHGIQPNGIQPTGIQPTWNSAHKGYSPRNFWGALFDDTTALMDSDRAIFTGTNFTRFKTHALYSHEGIQARGIQ
ncbi:Uncharacterized protein FKW44_016752 [Caligus rogercresseyi]|uniref:Uncharacterized protein n=1 Tax=Caligus rogercresseyi TaxID=217165 RepID=A0A7T8H2Y1_CALRO|nr:Uncharacterized protein FKW44_016752 [Caligus rogercresseyi]